MSKRLPQDKRQVDIRLKVQKDAAVKGLITGWAALSKDANGNDVIDHQGEFIPIEELESAVHKLMSARTGTGAAGEMHVRDGVADVVESFIVTKEKMAALGYPGDGPEGWVVTLKVTDPEVLKRVLSGELSELSIRGSAKRVRMGADEL